MFESCWAHQTHFVRLLTLSRLIIFACVTLIAGCAKVQMSFEPTVPTCRTTIPADATVAWISPFDGHDRGKLRAWCEAVGPVALHDPKLPPTADTRPLILVSWNMGVGSGDLNALMSAIEPPAGQPRRHVILLIQETFRQDDVPGKCPERSGVTARLGAKRPPAHPDALTFAVDRNMYAAYVPSMRNGRACHEEPREDRGNAILSTLPLSGITAIELPFAQQRRVAVAATVQTAAGVLHVMSVHLDTALGHRRQERGIAAAVKELGWDRDVVIGGDFNAWWLDSRVSLQDYGFFEADCTRRPTRVTGRLDRIFRRAGDAAPLSCAPGATSHGSDHLPLIAEIALRPT